MDVSDDFTFFGVEDFGDFKKQMVMPLLLSSLSLAQIIHDDKFLGK